MLNLRNLMCLVAVVGAAVLVGCSSQSVSQPATGPTSSSDWETGLDKDAVTALSQLSADDRTAALAQKVGPVSDEPLGSMGKPPKYTVEGQDASPSLSWSERCCGPSIGSFRFPMWSTSI